MFSIVNGPVAAEIYTIYNVNTIYNANTTYNANLEELPT